MVNSIGNTGASLEMYDVHLQAGQRVFGWVPKDGQTTDCVQWTTCNPSVDLVGDGSTSPTDSIYGYIYVRENVPRDPFGRPWTWHSGGTSEGTHYRYWEPTHDAFTWLAPFYNDLTVAVGDYAPVRFWFFVWYFIGVQTFLRWDWYIYQNVGVVYL